MTNPIHSKALLRVQDIVGDKAAQPPILPLIPIGRSTWWAGVKAGIYPSAIKLSPRVTVWRAEDVLRFIEELDK
jgi:prophage regulatory protein